MRKLLIASILFTSAGLASAQGTEGTEPQEGEPKKDTVEAKTQPPKTEPPATEEEEGEEEEKVEEVKEEKPKPKVSAVYDKGVVLSSEDEEYELKMQLRTQFRFESNRSLEDGSQFLNKFYWTRVRLQFEGHVFGENNRYKLELGMGDTGSFSFLKDAFIETKAAEGPVYVRVGQFRRPFFRQEMVSDFASEFNERSIVNEFAGGGRDLGIGLHNDYEKSAEGIEWVIGMFNGFSGGSDRPTIATACETDPMTMEVTCINSRPTTFKSDFSPVIAARAGWNSDKAKGYSEADLEGGPLRYSIAGAYKIDLGNFAKQGQASVADNLSHGLELDWMIKANGLSVTGGAVLMKLKSADPEFGVLVQPGMMIVPKKAQVAARFGLVTEGDRNLIEALGAFSYFWHGHRMKLATDFGILKRTGEDPVTMTTDKPDVRVRVMAQLEI